MGNNYRQYIEAVLGWFFTNLARAKGEEKSETISYVQFYSINIYMYLTFFLWIVNEKQFYVLFTYLVFIAYV